MKFTATGVVSGGKFLGEFEAATPEEAAEKALSDASVSLCHQCAGECEDPTIERVLVSSDDGAVDYDSAPPIDAAAVVAVNNWLDQLIADLKECRPITKAMERHIKSAEAALAKAKR